MVVGVSPNGSVVLSVVCECCVVMAFQHGLLSLSPHNSILIFEGVKDDKCPRRDVHIDCI